MVQVSPATDMTAEMLKEGYPQFEEASFILLEIEEVSMYVLGAKCTCIPTLLTAIVLQYPNSLSVHFP